MQLARQIAKKLRRESFKYIYPRQPEIHNFIFFSLRRKISRLTGKHRSRRVLQQLLPSFRTHRDTSNPFKPLVTIIVPCYNHEPYLRQRLDSIEQQTYRNYEVILIDDASTDGSIAILKEFSRTHPETTRLILNRQNSGKPFQQWAKGIHAARGELIWIAESDDFCEPDFLEILVPQFRNRAVMLAISLTQFVDATGKNTIWSLGDYLYEWDPEVWQKPFIDYAPRLVEKLWSFKNIVPNASGCLFRRPWHDSLLDEKWWQELRVCGDWLFYLSLCQCGLVAYTPLTTNYYRQHQKNSSVSLHRNRRFFDEHLLTADWIIRKFNLTEGAIQSVQQALRDRWKNLELGPISHQEIARINALGAFAKPRKPHLLLVTYALVGGGGEVFPIRLANGLRADGYSVSILNCDQKQTQVAVEQMVAGEVPVYTLDRLQDLGHLVVNLGVDLVHTHHAWVDTTFAELLIDFPECAHVITSHGMYDYMDDAELSRIGSILREKTCALTYVSSTNRSALLRLGFGSEHIRQISNAIPPQEITPLSREELGLSDDTFVICLVSRAMPEKGWNEAITAVDQLILELNKEIHLLLVGDGAYADTLRSINSNKPYIHFLGFKSNTLDYFSLSDIGILPTRFAGESQPLTVIECLQAGTPCIASRLGQIEMMLSTSEGLAGSLVDLEDGLCNPTALATAIKPFILNDDYLNAVRLRVPLAAAKFSWHHMLKEYHSVYSLALERGIRRCSTPTF